MKITLAIVLLFGVFHVIMSDGSPSSEELSGEYVDAVREKREMRHPNGTIIVFPQGTWNKTQGMGHGNGMWQGKGMDKGHSGEKVKPPQK
ncbi:unnamed protein product [Diamesa serratosioi]